MVKYYREKDRFEPISEAEVRELLAVMSDPDHHMAVILAWLTGARICEIVAFTKGDFQIDDGKMTVILRSRKHGKTGYPSFNITDPFVSEVIAHVLELPVAGYVLQRRSTRTYQYAIESANKLRSPEDTSKWLTFHYFRHGRISYLARVLNASAEEIKSWTGHRSTAYEAYFQPRRVERFRGKIR